MRSKRACICLFAMMGAAYSQTPRRTVPAPEAPATVSDLIPIQPVILMRASLDEKVVTLRLAPRIATSIRLPEPVSSVIVGDPENFQAEHSEHEPELVTIKPVNAAPAQTNLLINTTLGHQLNLLLLSAGENAAGQQAVDVLLNYAKPQTASFLVEETSFSPSFIAETERIGTELKRSEGSSLVATTEPLTELAKVSGSSNSSSDTANKRLDDLLARQKQAPLPRLYGQRPGEIEAGPRVKTGVSEVLDQGRLVVVLFSVVNPAAHAIEILPPQIQLGGKLKKKWTTAEQLYVVDFRLSTRRLGAGQRADGVVVFERPSFKQSTETLFLQIADSGAVDLPALAPIGFGISTFRGGSAYESR